MKKSIFSHFASEKELFGKDYKDIWSAMDNIHSSLNLPDHSELNRIRYPWSKNKLSSPEMYAARMWEYAFAIVASRVKTNDYCLDVGCGMSAFTVYLKDKVGARVIGTDPDFIKGQIRYKGHGVSQEFIKKTGLKIIKTSMEKLPFKNDTFEKIYCLSVIEHVTEDAAYLGIQEMARVLKPGGILVLTVDTNLKSNVVKPLNLIWDSGLVPIGRIDTKWPKQRFGVFENGKEPADIYGIVLQKDNYKIQTEFSHKSKRSSEVEAYKTPLYRYSKHTILLGVKIIWRVIYNNLWALKEKLFW